MTTQPVTQTDNGVQGVLLTSAALGNADTSQVMVFPPCINTYFWIEGTFGSATFFVEASFDGGSTWVTLATALTGTSAPANPVTFTPPGGAMLRFRTSGGTGTALTFYIGYSKAYI